VPRGTTSELSVGCSFIVGVRRVGTFQINNAQRLVNNMRSIYPNQSDRPNWNIRRKNKKILFFKSQDALTSTAHMSFTNHTLKQTRVTYCLVFFFSPLLLFSSCHVFFSSCNDVDRLCYDQPQLINPVSYTHFYTRPTCTRHVPTSDRFSHTQQRTFPLQRYITAAGTSFTCVKHTSSLYVSEEAVTVYRLRRTACC